MDYHTQAYYPPTTNQQPAPMPAYNQNDPWVDSGVSTRCGYIQNSEPESSSPFSESIWELEEQFHRTFPYAKNPPLVATTTAAPGQLTYDHLGCVGYFDSAGVFYRYVDDSHYPKAFSASSEVVARVSSTDVQSSSQVRRVEPEVPAPVHTNFNYSSPPQQKQKPQCYEGSCVTDGLPSPTTPTFNYDSYETGTCVQHTASVPTPSPIDPRQGLYVKVEPSYHPVPSVIDEIPPHMVVPSQQPLVDEIHRHHQWDSPSPVNMYTPYRQMEPELNQSYGHLAYPQSPNTTSPTSPSQPLVYPTVNSSSTDPSEYPVYVEQRDSFSVGMRHRAEYEHTPAASWASIVPSSSGPGPNQRLIAPAPYCPSPSPQIASPSQRSSSSRHETYRKRLSPKLNGSSHSRTSPHGFSLKASSSHRLLGSGGLVIRRRSPSPRLASCPTVPHGVSMRLSPLPAKRPAEKKPPLACLFCRGRKIACGPPVPGSKDKTCNQCQRRSLKCEYPLESRRGMRKKKTSPANVNTDGPKVTINSSPINGPQDEKLPSVKKE